MAGQTVVAAQRCSGGIHNRQTLVQHAGKGQRVVAHGIVVLVGVLVVDAVHHRGFKHRVSADLQGTQGAGGVGGEDGVAGAAAEHNDLAAFQRGDGFVAGEHLCHLRHKGAGHHHGRHALLTQRILDRQRVHNGCQHTDLVSVHTVHFAAGATAPEVAAAHNDADLHAEIVRRLDARADGGDGSLVKAGALSAGKRLAADF